MSVVGPVETGTKMAVIGAAGGVGVHLVQVAMQLGAVVVGVDVGDEKLQALEDLGVRAVQGEGWSHEVGGVDVVVDFVGAADTFESGYSLLRDGGRLFRMVTYKDISTAVIRPELGVGERTVTGSRYCSVDELKQALTLLKNHHVRPIIGDIQPMDRLASVVAKIDSRSLVGRAAVLMDESKSTRSADRLRAAT